MWYVLVFILVKVLTAFKIALVVGVGGYSVTQSAMLCGKMYDGVELEDLMDMAKRLLVVMSIGVFCIYVVPDKKEALIILGAGAMLETGIVEKGLEKIEKAVEAL